MKIEFTDQAKAYMAREDIKTIHIKMSTVSSCSVFFRPLVRKGLPESLENYDKYEVEGIEFYYDHGLPSYEEILIGYQKLGDMELLVVGGDREE